MYRVNKYITHSTSPDTTVEGSLSNITHFPLWMWKNNVIRDLISWLHLYNTSDKKVYLFGIDCYLFFDSYKWIITFLQPSRLLIVSLISSSLDWVSTWIVTSSGI